MIIRSFVVLSLLVWVVALHALLPTLFLVLLCVLGLYLQGLELVHLLKSFRLLLWLFIPTLFFHGFFTPGTMIQYPIYLPLSIEGLQRALAICAHIALVFFVAMFLFRLFNKAQWFSMLQHLSFMRSFQVNFLLLAALQQRVPSILQQQKQLWLAQQQRWSALPNILVESMQKVIAIAKEEAQKLWQNWDVRLAEVQQAALPIWTAQDMIYVLFLGLGWSIWWWL
jgi:energy-coupling factor transporter transmembrane protein EcfT